MAKLMEREAQGIHKGFITKASCLPPRFPTVPSQGSVMQELGTGFYIHSGTSTHSKLQGNQKHPQKSLSGTNVVMHEQPDWLNELLEDSERSRRRGSHRRSASDSFTFQEKAQGSCTLFTNILEEDELEVAGNLQKGEDSNKDSLAGDQLTDLLVEIQHLNDQQNLPLSAKGKSPYCNYESTNSGKLGNLAPCSSNSNSSSSLWDSLPRNLAFTHEAKSAADAGERFCNDNSTGESTSLSGSVEQNGDTKRAKRQSAQRSRVRKLQYIAELERIVTALQTQVSVLSPQVLYYKHQRTFLSMNNNTLRRQISLFMREKRIKDSENEMLMIEIQRLKKVHEFQILHDQQGKQQNLQRHKIYRHSSLPADLGFQMHMQYGASPTKNEVSSSVSLSGMMNAFTSLSVSSSLNNEDLIKSSAPDIPRAVQPLGCTAEGVNCSPRRELPEGAL